MIIKGLNRVVVLRYAPALFLAVSAALLLTVYLFQHVGGLEPCRLCVAQRYPHFAVLGLGLAAIFFGRRSPWLLAGLLGAVAAGYLTGAGYAAFHVGVELGHFQSACAGGEGGVGSIEELRQRIMQAPLARCDDVAWRFLGLSMAGWNGVLSVVLGLSVLYAALLGLFEARKRV